MSKVSLIIPIFNTEEYLNACLDSAVCQTLEDIEIICVNDGSTDNSLDILRKFASKDNRIIVLDQKNQGLSASRNNAIKIAKGEYLAFLDSDDTFELDALALMYNKIIKDDSDIVVSQPKKIDKKGNITISAFPDLNKNHFENFLNPNFSVSVCTKLFKKELFIQNSIQFPIGHDYEDHITSLKAFFYAKSVSYLSKAVYNYFLRENSITTKLTKKRIEDIFQVAKDYHRFLKEKNLGDFEYFILIKLVKLLSLYVFVQLKKSENSELKQYCFQEFMKIEYFTKDVLIKIKETMFGLYIDFLTKLIVLDDKNVVCEITSLLNQFPSNEVNNLKQAYKRDSEINFPKLLLRYVLKKKVKSLIIYGAGKSFMDMYPSLLENNIKVIAVIDKNINNLDEKINKDFLVINLEKYSELLKDSTILITSIAFCDEIKKNLKRYGYEHGISFDIVDIKKVLTN